MDHRFKHGGDDVNGRAENGWRDRIMATRRKKRGQRGLYNKRLTPDEQDAQRQAAFAAIRRLYCEVVPVWRACRRGFCRRHRCCCGDAAVCLARGWPLMPSELQKLAADQVKLGGPRRLPPATHTEWQLRRFPPANFIH
jgi:hypothetical protein